MKALKFLLISALLTGGCANHRVFFEGEIVEPLQDGVSIVPITGALVNLKDESTGNYDEAYSDSTGKVFLEITVSNSDSRTFLLTITKNGFAKTVQYVQGNSTIGIQDRYVLARE